MVCGEVAGVGIILKVILKSGIINVTLRLFVIMILTQKTNQIPAWVASTYKEFQDHAHWVIGEPGWEKIADYISVWMQSGKDKDTS